MSQTNTSMLILFSFFVLIQTKSTQAVFQELNIAFQTIPVNLKCFYINEFSTYSFNNYINELEYNNIYLFL